jgi:hypothetical protein
LATTSIQRRRRRYGPLRAKSNKGRKRIPPLYE